MISNEAVDSVIIRNCIPRPKLYNNLSIRTLRKNTFGLIKLKNISSISKELIFRIKL